MLSKATTLLAVLGLTRAVLAAPVEVCVQVEQVVYVYDDGTPVPADVREPSLNVLATVQITHSSSSTTLSPSPSPSSSSSSVFVAAVSSTPVASAAAVPPSAVAPASSAAATLAASNVAAQHVAATAAAAVVVQNQFYQAPAKLPNGQYLTISITNKMATPARIKHAENPGSPQPVGVNGLAVPQQASIPAGGSEAFVIETPWGGNIALLEDLPSNDFMGDESLIEIDFEPVGAWGVWIDVDVSYVSGYSIPATCKCQTGNRAVTGCTHELWDNPNTTCDSPNGRGSCRNPRRDDEANLSAPPFFSPCEHLAYTYPDDHAGNAENICTGQVIECCLGSSCTPRQEQVPLPTA